MSFTRWDHEFDGAYTDPNDLQSAAGVYVIWCKTDNSWTILDVGESDDVNDRINKHDRADCWRLECQGTIYYSATYIDSASDREALERTIRSSETVACGEC